MKGFTNDALRSGSKHGSVQANITKSEEHAMKRLGGNRFALSGDPGEVITVKVTSLGTAFLVVYKVDGGEVIDGPNQGPIKEGAMLRFRLVKVNGSRNNLNLGFTFATPGAVAGEADAGPVEYDVEVTGSAAGSDTSREIVDGSFGIPADNRQWRFFIN